MTLKAVILDFNGVIVNDRSITEQFIEQIFIEENLILNRGEYRQVCLGKSDRACLYNLLRLRGRVVSEASLTKLLNRKALVYAEQLEKVEKLPLYTGLDDLIFQVRSRNLKLALVSSTIRQEIELVLNRSQLAQYFEVIVAGDEITSIQPEPDSYLLAVERLNQEYNDLNLQPEECLAIEDTPAAIQAAKLAGMQVVGVANTYPFHMLQRFCNWTVDYLTDLEWERVQDVYAQKEFQPTVEEC